MKIAIRNGRVVDPASGRDEVTDVRIAAGRIVGIGPLPADFGADRVLQAAGCIVAPGLVDLAARLREPPPGRARSARCVRCVRRGQCSSRRGGQRRPLHLPEATIAVALSPE